jgi:hypothetical protein
VEHSRTLVREAWGGTSIHRGAYHRARFAAFFLLALAVMVGAALSDERAALAQNQTPVAAAVLAQETYGCPEEERPFEAGGALCVSDWFAYLPLALLSVAIVIVVDGVALYIIFRGWRRGRVA